MKLTIDSVLTEAFGSKWVTKDFFKWPPNLFGAAATLLHRSSAYFFVLEKWPPKRSEIWAREIQSQARTFRERLIKIRRKVEPPARFAKLWNTVVTKRQTALDRIQASEVLVTALLELLAFADECSVGLGMPMRTEEWSEFLLRGNFNLEIEGSLVPDVDSHLFRVLPKQHTPSYGMTLRSLSHYLSFIPGMAEVDISWSVIPHKRADRLNVMLVPWPFEVRPRQFSEARCPAMRFPEAFGCFDYRIPNAPSARSFQVWLNQLLKRALADVDRIDLLVFPESALSQQLYRIAEAVAKRYGCSLIAGVGGPELARGKRAATLGFNQVWMSVPLWGRCLMQPKHHRWKLDRQQIEMYGLGSSLNPSKTWWENIPIQRREMTFVAMHDALTLCCLVCEDLARQDPIAHVVRSVGPNLVIALLSDGPQISGRWPGRYATVLTDDPGSSVLTFTSWGMTEMCEPPPGKEKSYAVALWRDQFNGLREITMTSSDSAVVLNLWSRRAEEWTADGRSDGGDAAFPALAGVHPVRIPRLETSI